MLNKLAHRPNHILSMFVIANNFGHKQNEATEIANTSNKYRIQGQKVTATHFQTVGI